MAQANQKSINDYTLLTVIGKAIYGKILLIKQKKTQKVYALKTIKKKLITESQKINNIFTQRNLLIQVSDSLNLQFDHPFIIKMLSTFQDDNKIYFVQEYCPGGQLFSLLSMKEKFTEQQVKFYIAQIILAFQYIHKKDIVYRDLKPQNILIDKQGYVKLTDFGLSKKLKQNQSRNFSIKGMPQYMAPEILHQQNCGQAVDFWCLGSLMYQMLTGCVPFYSKNLNQLYQNIKFQQFKPDQQVELSDDCVDLLKKLFVKDPNQRIGMKDENQIKAHSWFKGINWEAVYNKKYRAPFIPILQSDDDISYFCPQVTQQNVHSVTSYDESHSDDHFLDDQNFQGFQYNADSEQEKSQGSKSPKKSIKKQDWQGQISF